MNTSHMPEPVAASVKRLVLVAAVAVSAIGLVFRPSAVGTLSALTFTIAHAQEDGGDGSSSGSGDASSGDSGSSDSGYSAPADSPDQSGPSDSSSAPSGDSPSSGSDQYQPVDVWGSSAGGSAGDAAPQDPSQESAPSQAPSDSGSDSGFKPVDVWGSQTAAPNEDSNPSYSAPTPSGSTNDAESPSASAPDQYQPVDVWGASNGSAGDSSGASNSSEADYPSAPADPWATDYSDPGSTQTDQTDQGSQPVQSGDSANPSQQDASLSPAASQSRQTDQQVADQLGWDSFTAQETSGNGGYFAQHGTAQTDQINERTYDSADVPDLSSNQVLVAGPSTAAVDSSGQRQGGNTDTYYVVDKSTLPSNYTLEPASSLTTSDGQYEPVYRVVNTSDALSQEKATDSSSDSNYGYQDQTLAGLPQGSDSYAQEFVTENQSLTQGSKDYNAAGAADLQQFTDYGQTLASDSNMTQTQKEQAAYDYVNNTVKTADVNSTSYDPNHTLSDAVEGCQGVCRDKAPALVDTLNGAGIDAKQVDSPGHTFVAVLNSDGSVNHYLDPMGYETYLSIPAADRSAVQPYQLHQ